MASYSVSLPAIVRLNGIRDDHPVNELSMERTIPLADSFRASLNYAARHSISDKFDGAVAV